MEWPPSSETFETRVPLVGPSFATAMKPRAFARETDMLLITNNGGPRFPPNSLHLRKFQLWMKRLLSLQQKLKQMKSCW